MYRRTFLQLSAAASLLASGSRLPAEAAYPSKGIDVIIPFAPGGPADIAARIAINHLRPHLNHANIVPNNRPGAGGGVGADFVAKSRPDGYTILATGNSTLSVKTAIEKNISFKIDDFAPVGMYAIDVSVLGIRQSLGITSIEQLVEYAKENPDKLNYGSAGRGTAGHISGELFAHATGIKMMHVPYNGAGPAALAVQRGDVQLIYGGYTAMRSLLDGGNIVPLITSAPRRIPALPNLPTLAEKGYGGSELNIWSALYVPAETPQSVLQKLATALAEASRSAEMIAATTKAGLQADYGNAERVLSLLKQEYDNVAKLAKVVDLGG
jgi:tripartite-type tricarboxylate transporter receptor subunit TctC